MTPTAAAARRVVKLETAIDRARIEKRGHGPGREDAREEPRGLGGGRPEAGEDEGEQHEEQRAEGDQEHDGEDARSLCGQVASAVERPGEVEAEHPGAPVRAQRLGGDERCEERKRAADEEHVVAVADEVVGDDVVRDDRERDRDERGQERDRERDRGQHLVARRPARGRARDGP